MPLIEFTNKGLHCAAGNFYIDPWRPVEKAVITHAHSDHARWGHGSYLCHHFTKPLLQLRLGIQNFQSVEWNEAVSLNGVKVSLHPAGHIIGSSQIRVEHHGEVWVVSGDYKTENDGISGVFEPVKCNSFITESTFGLPIYNWKRQDEIFLDIQNWIRKNQATGITSVLTAYSIGKAQRLLGAIQNVAENIFAHGAIWNVQETLVNGGWKFPAVQKVSADTPKEKLKASVVLVPSFADNSAWMKRFYPYAIAECSGWMQVRGNVRRRNADAGFALSDHADWNGLLDSVKATGAEMVYVTHGFQSAFSRFLNENSIHSSEVKTEFGTDDEEAIEANSEQADTASPDEIK